MAVAGVGISWALRLLGQGETAGLADRQLTIDLDHGQMFTAEVRRSDR